MNETELRSVLDRHDVEFIPDRPRSVAEQIRLFRDASLIIGPHGAGFTNLLWCAPRTKIIELFHGGYHPPYYYYLATMLGQSYACWISEREYLPRSHLSCQYRNMYVPPEDLSLCLAGYDPE